jgi:hypothetical protein
MTCPRCHCALPTAARFCFNCGIHLFSQQNPPHKKQWGMLKTTMVGGLIFLALICLVIMLGLSFQSRNLPGPTESSFASSIPATSPSLNPSPEHTTIARRSKANVSPSPSSHSQGAVVIAPQKAKEPAAVEARTIYTRGYITGPRGGCYYINSNGNKTYVDRSLCGGTVSYSGSNRGGYITGPRGGCYYINGNGNKTYVDRSLCR